MEEVKLLSIAILAALAGLTALWHPKPVSAQKLIDKVSASLVFIHGDHESEDGGSYSCTGWVIVKEYVMTNEHCVGEHMTADKRAMVLEKAEEFYDLALYRVEGLEKPALNVRVSKLEPFEQTFAAGYAYGWRRPTFLQTAPVLTNFSPSPQLTAGTLSQFPTIPGMSGGPTVDHKGRVVGMNCASDHSATNYSIDMLHIRVFLADTVIDLED